MKKKSLVCCDSLSELLKSHSPEGFYPWRVKIGTIEKFCFARSKIDAIKKVMNQVAIATPVTVQEIMNNVGLSIDEEITV